MSLIYGALSSILSFYLRLVVSPFVLFHVDVLLLCCEMILERVPDEGGLLLLRNYRRQ